MKKILVCGGRDFGYTIKGGFKVRDNKAINTAVDFIKSLNPTSIIQGGAKGADEVGLYTSEVLSIPCETFKADWDTHKKAAGPIRNSQMLVEGKPDLVVAFPGGVGTADMVKKAKKAGVPVVEVTGYAEPINFYKGNKTND